MEQTKSEVQSELESQEVLETKDIDNPESEPKNENEIEKNEEKSEPTKIQEVGTKKTWRVAKKRASEITKEGETEIVIRKSKKSKKEDPLSKAIRMIVETGKYDFGTRKAIKNSLLGKAKLMIISSNCKPMTAMSVRKYCNLSGIKYLEYAGTSRDLGSVCGKPFPVSILSVYEEGNSLIFNFVE